MKDDGVYLRHILECIRRIEEEVTPIRSGWPAASGQLVMLRRLLGAWQ